MSDQLKQLRAAAEPYKSFPKAVAAVVRAMFDKGATEVTITFCPTVYGPITVNCDAWWCNRGDLLQAAPHVDPEDRPAWALAFVHHSETFETTDTSFRFIYPSFGEGVNQRQDRSDKRLIRELPRHLSPSESYRTVVIDEQGTEHTLMKSLPSTTINGLRISWPEKMIGFGREGLTLKFGAVRVSMRSFLDRLILEPREHEQLMLLTHPWLQGIVEIEVADAQVANMPVPHEPADNFDDAFYRRGHADQLAQAILQIVPDVALREMNKLVASYIHDFVEDDGLFLSGHTYKIVCADPLEVQRSEGRLLWKHPGSTNDTTQLLLDVTNPVFLTVSTYDREVMQIIWWQLATWIEFNDRAIIDNPALLQAAITRTYLSLRRQNPERTLID